MIRQIGRYVVLEDGVRDWLGTRQKAFDTVSDHLVSLRLIDAPADYVPQSLSMQSLGGWARQTGTGRAHLVGVHDIGIAPVDGTQANRIFVAGGWVRGNSLEEILRERGAITLAQAYAWMAQILLGLGAVHALGIVHGDLNPGNVWVDRANQIRLLDAGLYSRERFPWIDARENNRAAAYTAPEQLSGALPSASGDLYAAGAVGYRMVMGCEAHDAGARATAGEPFDGLLDWAMAPVPAQRFQSAADFLREPNAGSRTADALVPRPDTWPMLPEQLRRLTARLSNDVGPMASILIERAAALAESREDFFLRLLDIVPERDRTQRLLRQFRLDQESAHGLVRH